MRRGSAIDVARAFSQVKQRSHDLLKLNVAELRQMALRTPSILFQPHHQQQQQQLDDHECACTFPSFCDVDYF